LTVSLVVTLVGLLLACTSPKVVHNVRNEMAEFVLPLRKEIKDSLTRRGMQNLRGLHRSCSTGENRILNPNRCSSTGNWTASGAWKDWYDQWTQHSALWQM